uniref:Membrane associated guanylate kinase, WW and PDZ domain containing 2 n=1 Tax=Nothobranchius kadleci TaxID=1051664 RepID=A0A1A8DAJ8_NOTKA
MSKSLKKKNHWTNKVHEAGGAENGQFPYFGEVKQGKGLIQNGKLAQDELLLEVNDMPVAGLTTRDVLAVIKHCKDPVRFKCVKQGGVVDKDLRHYLNLRFSKGSVDHDHQQIIRDNLYLRTVPCTTRQPKEGEVPGVDYSFVSVERFMELEQSGALLESGTYEDNFYGTPKPPAEPSPAAPPLNVSEALLPGARPSAQGKRKRNQSVSNMEQRTSLEPPEEEEEEIPVVNGNGVAITPESSEHEDKSTDASGEVAVEGSSQAPASSEPATEGEEATQSPSKSPSKVPDVDEEELEGFDLNKPDPYDLYEKSRAIYESRRPEYEEVEVHLLREKTGFGFRILGGDEAVQAVSPDARDKIVIGAIIENTPAERDGRLRPGDELISVDKNVVAGKPHKYVIDLMHSAARNGQVSLTVRRRVQMPGDHCPVNGRSPGSVSTQHSSPRSDAASAPNPSAATISVVTSPPEGSAVQTSDVVINRKENEGFGFVIISSLNRPENATVITVPHKIGRIIEGSPADRCGKLKVGDRILAVNGQSIISMPHADIVKLIKDAGLTVTLHIIPEEGSQSGPSSEKQSPMTQKHSPQTQPSPVAQPGLGGTQSGQMAPQPGLASLQPCQTAAQPGQTPALINQIVTGPPAPAASQPASAGSQQSPVTQPSGLPPQLYLHDGRSEVKARQDVKPDFRHPTFTDYRQPPVDYRHPPVTDYRQPPTLDYRHPPGLLDFRQHPAAAQFPLGIPPDFRPQDYDYFTVELEKSTKGFGFSIRGGREYSMDLFVLRLAEDGPAIRNGRMRVGDQIIEINGDSTRDMTHARAIELIKAGGRRVRLLLKRGTGQVPDYGMVPSNLSMCMKGDTLSSPYFFLMGHSKDTTVPAPGIPFLQPTLPCRK